MANPVMPKMPGYVFDDPSLKPYHGKAQTLRNGQVDSVPRGSSAVADEPVDIEALAQATKRLTYNTTTRSTTEQAVPSTEHSEPAPPPAHVALDKVVLTFDGYFKETIHESADEHYRVRFVKVFYFLEDDTMAVLEPAVPNSGLPQGKLIRRQRLPKDSEGNTYLWSDLGVGVNLQVYGRVFRLTDCDQFTRRFFEEQGVTLNEAEPQPVDPYALKRKVVEQPSTLSTTPSDFDKLKQFVTLDRKVLRVYAVWDDTASLHGSRRTYTIHYFLVDDTVEVREQHVPNDGRDAFPLLLRRQKVLRNHRDLPVEFPSIVMEPSASENSDYIGPADLLIGQTVHIMGRDFLVYDCDAFTQEFFRRNFGVEDLTPLDISEPGKPVPKAPVPSHTGFGSEEDSLQSVLALNPRAPKSNMNKLLKYDKQVLRFRAQLDTKDVTDVDRSFIITYTLASDQISIFEPKSRTAMGGKFLEAQKIRRPGGAVPPVYYSEGDLYPGAKLQVFGRTFLLGECDEFVYTFAQEHPELYGPEGRAAFGLSA
ncbi:uncharacterized protein MONBRDRAFT_33364 [Monosiga brevicollis MX1]|uniref:DM10 domain-containing protein n=1 Tax=Monosiga brevicollis TaxID=81824 RepID=A9V502_MONBE|nr:uncharacterized protein MONBRDRAFT_33364 [Monosiga brevicollis MX1]EDQ87460.1 predicted protein [Monosiga brevicollis MX1]|eukprot:XP_001747720.1 hypothetical protein [Monosiga brevicollis MX1]